ncbi:putative bifunctional inhibitor/plant lipid transfer protein/seed storage helical [Rosa chinensis]|uniref:Putative bifunctional inhibitor/plant lipid transfer protein/seed storage helical n=1 Tax=Rosa chinensis TaxID=74649 RepID=A0A2P6SAS2_ROSCH|nr:probable non-specific lipid-transfer protein AKCS9 [Rosa chinensis]PRQ55759.1 putative bifunctional inhibitor/plant lipid transfer protein/seed storage helical [Rosa chinensis]
MERAGLVVVMICLLCLVGVVPMAEGDTTPSQCKQEKNLLVGACKPIIFGLQPSAACCQRVRVTHAECVCPYLSPKVANLINVKRSIKQIQGCGRTVPHNFKCGSVTTP